MDTEKTKLKLKTLTDAEVRKLLSLVQDELSERPEYLSNINNTPREQAKALGDMFSRAWIHG